MVVVWVVSKIVQGIDANANERIGRWQRMKWSASEKVDGFLNDTLQTGRVESMQLRPDGVRWHGKFLGRILLAFRVCAGPLPGSSLVSEQGSSRHDIGGRGGQSYGENLKSREKNHHPLSDMGDSTQIGALPAGLKLLDDETVQLALFPPLGQHVVELHSPVRVLLQEPWSVILAFAVVVPRRTHV